MEEQLGRFGKYVSPRRRGMIIAQPRHTRSKRRLLTWSFGVLAVVWLLGVWHHRNSIRPARPTHELDALFYPGGCQDPTVHAAQPREAAVFVMLARNKEIDGAKRTVAQVEDKFNKWFRYPYLFLNNEPWDEDFIQELNASTGGLAKFEVISEEQWTFPKWMDVEQAKADIKAQGEGGIHYGGLESYHHMCRFYSGHFYILEALRPYKWYWRLEPDVNFACSLTYDPFVEMSRHNKIYGWVMSPTEESATCPSLFKAMDEWKEAHGLPTKDIWKSILSAAWAPWPLRPFLSWFRHHNHDGDSWNKCHYWSNFEIANLDFFRSKEYQDLFDYLDHQGGFYRERWGDAPIHSLAVAMMLDPQQVHYFEDIGYTHDLFFYCPANTPGKQLEDVSALGPLTFHRPQDGGVGCRCDCDGTKRQNYDEGCINDWKRLTRP